MIGNPQQQGGQEIPLVCIQRREERVLVFARDAANRPENLLGLGRDFQQIDTPVTRIFESPYQPPVLQFIDKGHESTGKHPQPFRNFLLARSARGSNQTQRTDVRRR